MLRGLTGSRLCTTGTYSQNTWMCHEYVTMLLAYIHDCDKTAINIESSTFEFASPQRGGKRDYGVANASSPQRGEKRPCQDASAASPQCGGKKTYPFANAASPVGSQTTTSSMGANSPRVCGQLQDPVFTNFQDVGQRLQVNYDVRGVVRICMPSPVNIETRDRGPLAIFRFVLAASGQCVEVSMVGDKCNSVSRELILLKGCAVRMLKPKWNATSRSLQYAPKHHCCKLPPRIVENSVTPRSH